jgi:hypothetical protein
MDSRADEDTPIIDPTLLALATGAPAHLDPFLKQLQSQSHTQLAADF